MEANNNMNGSNALSQVFNNETITENGDKCFKSTGNILLDILFCTEYYRGHLSEVPQIGETDKMRLFARFIRDPRYGLGQKDLGRKLMLQTGCTPDQVAISGRFDDVWRMFIGTPLEREALEFLKEQVENGHELAKKWMPRWQHPGKEKTDLTPKQKEILSAVHTIARSWGLRKSEYSKLIKVQTVESCLSQGNTDLINFSHVPSLASIRYAAAFQRREDTRERYLQYLEAVRNGEATLHLGTATPYDIYRQAMLQPEFDADLFFEQLPKISGNWIPVIDTSGSMYDSNDSIGKAISIGYYLSVCSNYAPGMGVTFSSRPELYSLSSTDSYREIIEKIKETNWGGSTDLSLVMDKLRGLSCFPEYIIILSDMQFNEGSSESKDSLMRHFKAIGAPIKIVWWNFNSRSKSVPETDGYGNVFISGYNPMLLSYLEAGFDGEKFLEVLLAKYAKTLGE